MSCNPPGASVATRPQLPWGRGLGSCGCARGWPVRRRPEAVRQGVGVGGHGVVQGGAAGIQAGVAGEVVLVVPGGRADRERPGRVEDGGVALLDAQRVPAVGVGILPSKAQVAADCPASRPSSADLAASGSSGPVPSSLPAAVRRRTWSPSPGSIVRVLPESHLTWSWPFPSGPPGVRDVRRVSTTQRGRLVTLSCRGCTSRP
jgi:hypothetical protein